MGAGSKGGGGRTVKGATSPTATTSKGATTKDTREHIQENRPSHEKSKVRGTHIVDFSCFCFFYPKSMCVCELVGPVCVCVCALQFVVTIFVAYFSGHFTLNNKPKVFNGKGDGYERRFGGLLCVTRCVWRTQAHTRTHSQTHTHTKNRHETQRGALGVYAIVAGCGHIKYTPWLTRAFAQLKKKNLTEY